jgi:hypothetical protein
MKFKLLTCTFAALALSLPTFAQDDFNSYTQDLAVQEVDFSEVPAEVEEALVGDASKNGHNLDSPRGRKKFSREHKKQKFELAQKLGFDLKTSEGRQGFGQYMDDQFQKVAEEKGVDMKSPEGRQAVIQEFAARGQLPLIPLNRAPFEKHGWKFEPRPLDVRQMPREMQGVMANQAAELGFDISTKEGQQEFANHMYGEKVKDAKAAGFDYTKPEGKENYEKHAQKEVRKLAREQKWNLKKPEARKKAMESMAKSGQFALIPTEPRAMEKIGFDAPPMMGQHRGNHQQNLQGKERKSAKGDNKQHNGYGQKRTQRQTQRAGASVKRTQRQGGQQQARPQRSQRRAHRK